MKTTNITKYSELKKQIAIKYGEITLIWNCSYK